MLDPSQFNDYMLEQNALGNSITDTLKGMGIVFGDTDSRELDDDGTPKLTPDEQILGTLAHHAIGTVIDAIGPQIHPEHLTLQGILIGLALGYSQGVREGNPFYADDTPTTFPEGWVK